MKINKKLVFGITLSLFLFATTVYAVSSADFFTKGKKYIDNNCSKPSISNQTSLNCYLFYKLGEIETLVNSNTSRLSDSEADINDLKSRVTELENLLHATPTPTPTPSPSPQTTYIISDSTWKFSIDEVSGWLTSGFDDSSWISVIAPSMGQCGPNPVGGGITENGVLNISVSDPDWTSGTGYFRKTFHLDSIPSSALLRVLIDDDGDVYINGNQMVSDHDGHIAGISIATPSPSDFVVGDNVIAVKAIDASPNCQWVQVELTINQ